MKFFSPLDGLQCMSFVVRLSINKDQYVVCIQTTRWLTIEMDLERKKEKE
jgi:hypothetical protein